MRGSHIPITVLWMQATFRYISPDGIVAHFTRLLSARFGEQLAKDDGVAVLSVVRGKD